MTEFSQWLQVADRDFVSDAKWIRTRRSRWRINILIERKARDPCDHADLHLWSLSSLLLFFDPTAFGLFRRFVVYGNRDSYRRLYTGATVFRGTAVTGLVNLSIRSIGGWRLCSHEILKIRWEQPTLRSEHRSQGYEIHDKVFENNYYVLERI